MQRKNTKPAKGKRVADASKLSVGIVVSDFNSDITEKLLDGALQTLAARNVPTSRISVLHVSGSFEIPFGCQMLIKKKKPDTLIALGCIVKGETEHDRHIAAGTVQGLMDLMLVHETPISFGVLTVNSLAQAKARSRGHANKGVEAAEAALQMALL